MVTNLRALNHIRLGGLLRHSIIQILAGSFLLYVSISVLPCVIELQINHPGCQSFHWLISKSGICMVDYVISQA